MEIYAKSDKGMVRELNQDTVDYGFIDDNFSWILVCDGMGGQNAGDIASNLTSKIIKNTIEKKYSKNLNNEGLLNLMDECFELSNKEVLKNSQKDDKYFGMGTTAVLAFIRDNCVYISYVGDSRAYIVSDKKLTQLTTDHSMVQEMVINGEITEEEAKNHPKRNIITRAIGVKYDLKVDHVIRDFSNKDLLLICTDGFSNYMDEKTLIEYFEKFNGELLVDKLIEYANMLGGKDNITVAVATL